ncbi:GDP-mannose 4,6-dehydratase [Roseibium sp. M-1]
MTNVLITGISGQDGAFLAGLLLRQGYQVYGGMRRGSTSKTSRLKELGIREKIKFCTLEVTEFANVQEVLNEIRPERIFNLAAQSFVADSFKFPRYTSEVNCKGLLNILEATRQMKLDTKIYQASTSEMFGDVLEKPQSERTPFNPLSPYAVSKLAAHSLVLNYRQAYNIFASSGILFNHESELRGCEFVTRKITSWLANIKLLDAKAMPLGNMDSVRDWGYAPEYVEAMIKMLDQEKADDFIISTNTEYSVRDFLFIAAGEMGFDLYSEGEGVEEKCFDRRTGKLVAYVDPRYFRASDVVYLRGDNTKAKKILDWKPTVFTPEIARRMAIYDLKKAAIHSRTF